MIKRSLVLCAWIGLAACGGGSDPADSPAPSGSDPSASSNPGGDAGSSVDPSPSTPPPPPPASSSPDDASVPAPPPSTGPYPIVLVHGMAGFDKLDLGVGKMPYWNGIVADLAEHRELAFVTETPPFDTSEARAASLSDQIDAILAKTHASKVNIIAHSQGGLDARVLVSPAGLDQGSKVASVTTISTPHRGSRVADGILGSLKGVPDSVLDDMTSAVLQLAQKTIYDFKSDPHLRAQAIELSEKYMAETFNPKYTDAPNVTYWSYAGRSNLRSGKGICDTAELPNDPMNVDPAAPELVVTSVFLEDGDSKVNVNDGLVTVASAKWGKFIQCVPADHLKEVGVLSSGLLFDQKAFVRGIVERLRLQGF